MLSTHRVEIVEVDFSPHPNAETLSVAKIFGGYDYVGKTSDWVGVKKAAFIPPDSVISTLRPEFAIYASMTKAADGTMRVKANGQLIVRNGQVIAQVPGTATYFRETGLPPATSFRFQVFAIRNDKKGPRSSVLTVTTVTPPVSAAVLAEVWSVHWKVLSASSNANAKVGQTWNDSWNFTPACPAATFAAASLARSGSGYSGNTTVGGSCSGSGGKINFTDTMRIQLQVQDAKVQGGTWTATSWTGSVTLHIPAASNATLNCSAATVQMNISGTP